jgi:hypothetical protein
MRGMILMPMIVLPFPLLMLNSISFGFLSLPILFSPDFRPKYIAIRIIKDNSGANGLNITNLHYKLNDRYLHQIVIFSATS